MTPSQASLNEIVMGYHPASWVLDGPRDQPHDPGLPLILLLHTDDVSDDMDRMELLIEAHPREVAAAVGTRTGAALLGLVTDPAGPPQDLLADLAANGFQIICARPVTLAELDHTIGTLREPIRAIDKLAAVIYQALGMPIQRLRRRGLHSCPAPELSHACGEDYFWCAHELFHYDALFELDEQVLTE